MSKRTRSKPRLSAALVNPIKSGKLPLPDGYQMPSKHGHQRSFKTVRKATYRRSDIRVETTYKITIDGQPLQRHTMVLDDGTVHCHDFPNYSFPSAMDMVRKIIDSMIEFAAPANELKQGPNQGRHSRQRGAGIKGGRK